MWIHDLTKKRQWQRQRQWQRHLENTLKEWSQRLMIFETFDESDEETWPDQQKDNDKDKDNEKHKDNDKWKTPPKNNPRDLLTLRNWTHFWQLNIHCDPEHSQWPLDKEWQGQHSQFLRCFTSTSMFLAMFEEEKTSCSRCKLTMFFLLQMVKNTGKSHNISNSICIFQVWKGHPGLHFWLN